MVSLLGLASVAKSHRTAGGLAPGPGVGHVGRAGLGRAPGRTKTLETGTRIEAHHPGRDGPAREAGPASARHPARHQQQHGDGQAGRKKKTHEEQGHAK